MDLTMGWSATLTLGLLQGCPSYGRNWCWLLARANGTWLHGPLGDEKTRENSNFRKIEMANIKTEAVSTRT
jgi:hypothetical protein